MALAISHVLFNVTSRQSISKTNNPAGDHGHALPFISSPVDPEAYAWLHRKKMADPLVTNKVRRSRTVQQFEDDHGTDSQLAKTIFRKQHEASSLELFFDLFFVANLAIFTDFHAHNDAQSVANYIGFFSILWTTWFHVSIYDVRFYAECMLSRLFKLLIFGVMTSFVAMIPIYDAIIGKGESQAFAGMAYVLMGFRFLLVIQYGIVLYFVHGFHKTLAPLLLTIAVYGAAGVGFLVTAIVDRHIVLTGDDGAQHIVWWYLIIGLEIAATLIISSTWRVLSFRHTHLVERVGLLTLIVMGEGILGMLKSIAYSLLGTNASVWDSFGIIAAAVVTIWFIYCLYFYNVPKENTGDQWGSVAQQVWVILHYFLHVAILLTVEGQTALIIWYAARQGCMWFEIGFPDVYNPAHGYDSATALVTVVNDSVNAAADRFHYYKLADYYDQTSDLSKLQSITAPYGSPEWNATASPIMNKILHYVQYFIFANYQAEGTTAIEETEDVALKVDLYNTSFEVVFEYFYIAAGCFLIMLAVMYIFAKKRLRKDEWASIIIRLALGTALPIVSIVGFLEEPGDTSGFRYQQPGWIIPIVTYVFLATLFIDNMTKVGFNLVRNHRRNSAISAGEDEETANRRNTETLEAKAKATQSQTHLQHGRMGSDDSDMTMADRRNGSRGYAHLVQEDSEDTDEQAPKSYRTYMA